MGKRNGGFSLIETLIAMVILGCIVVPTCTALVMSIRLNEKTEQMLQAQLAVSSAVETLMAEGMTGVVEESDGIFSHNDNFDDVDVKVTGGVDGVYYNVTVTDVPAEGDPLVTVTTTIRAAKTGGDS